MRVLVVLSLFCLCQAEIFTLNSGKPVDDAINSQSVSAEGPILLQDYQLIERLQIHNRERIPERNVHARGTGAKGYFKATADVSNLTFAKFLEKGKTTPISCRFSSVIHSKGSPEWLRDPRGFALKFYTEEGNYDVVGLNFPVFFIRDGIRFPEMIRALKPNPVSGVQEWWRIWDYFSHFPESTHMFTWLMDDVGVPTSYRHVDGWGIHTYKWINTAGKETWVRYYYKSNQGVKSFLTDQEAMMQHFTYMTTDMYENIKNGTFPSWKVYIQKMTPEQAAGLSWNPLDTTYAWPVSQFPYMEIGEFTFNENPTSQFLENEMMAFSPAHFIPGIEPSDEKMLQTRMFAYADTQRYRLGVNNQMLPINKPKCPFMDNHIDGAMNFMTAPESKSTQEVNYYPSDLNNVHTAKPYPHESEVDNGKKVRQMISRIDDFTQPGDRWRSFDVARQQRFAQRVGSTLTDPRITEKIKQTWMGYWKQADPNLAAMIEKYSNNFRASGTKHSIYL
eukprot:TRINITY_DN8524_c0_g1_i1.p1 TRINITY_DN8524_c0_g1~~TRINITY_DN8524_c0_g1_i1.p1  ORF type:complete len:504 (+),score=95.68 TRINITY_DN8524_c0_g1_i1:46-1557(+)